jgi:hypothetical protein
MNDNYMLNFGTYRGKALLEIANTFPSYLLWIGGVTTKYSLTNKAKELYATISRENPDDILAVKEFMKDKCRRCWTKLAPDNTKHTCKVKKTETFHHYHPYGKRT